MLPAPMLARSGVLPPSDGSYAYEPKWDGFRAIVRTGHKLRVRSRRGWDMTSLLPELADMPPRLIVDGEIVAFGDDGLPSFPILCRRMLNGDDAIPIVLVAFDLLVHGEMSLMPRSYRTRRQRLETLQLHGHSWAAPACWADGEELHAATLERGMEGVVAKRWADPYRPGRRGWIKVKHRSYWRYAQELESLRREIERRARRRHLAAASPQMPGSQTTAASST